MVTLHYCSYYNLIDITSNSIRVKKRHIYNPLTPRLFLGLIKNGKYKKGKELYRKHSLILAGMAACLRVGFLLARIGF